MKTFSDDIVTPGILQTAITTAFTEQNAFFEQQTKQQHKSIRIMLGVSIALNIITLIAVFL